MYANLFLVLWDNACLEQLQHFAKLYPLVFIESMHDFNRHPHHRQKLVFLISAMRHMHLNFPDATYIKTKLSIPEVLKLHFPNVIVHLVRPGEYEYITMLEQAGFQVVTHEDNRFLCSMDEFKKLNPNIMETFYRYMRRKTGFLMCNGKPVGGKWNFDKANRNKMPAEIKPPEMIKFEPDEITLEVMDMVSKSFTFGNLENFAIAVTRKDTLKALEHFLVHCLPNFGLYQDAMKYGEVFGFHSFLSHYLNIGLLLPSEVCEAVEQSEASLEAKEGFIRQIIGWREFIRGVYWTHMPEYKNLNVHNFQTALPHFYWTGKTEMRCMQHVLNSTINYAYSHHIQRLMITGNYAALIGVKPSQITEWYLGAYLDAHEWVELPNTLGMATNADNCIVGTKPYIASAAYINKMSDFCKKCPYNYKDRYSCPFNFLYWDFLIRNDFRKNARMAIPYQILDKMTGDEVSKIKNKAVQYRKSLEEKNV
jgi:deoxyribodipyrimidine photolyase-related protein